MTSSLTLVSHALCPYVQRIAIALAEKQVAHDRITVDLANKPDWFLAISPLGRTPVLKVGEAALFESGAILEFLEDTQAHPLHPEDPVERARHRAWIGFGAEILADIAAFYSARGNEAFEARIGVLRNRFRRVEAQLGQGPWFAGARFSLVDAAYAPVFRYFDTVDEVADFGFFTGLDKLNAWRAELARRPSVRAVVGADYGDRLRDFMRGRGSALSKLMDEAERGARP
ncbi:MAG: glutathione S-transferase family protein [Hoeflea sp.]|nr:glutathione S-transferase family protein [Hoeflea sp.]